MLFGFATPAARAYEGDHYVWTYYLALHSGFTERQAYQIASGAYAVDFDPRTGPMPASTEEALEILAGYPQEHIREIWLNYHAFTNHRLGDAVIERTKRERKEALWRLAVEEGNPGPLLHYTQDYYPHFGWEDIRGHAAFGHVPDFPSFAPDDFWLATLDTLDVLERFRAQVLCRGGGEPCPPPPALDRNRLREAKDRLLAANPLPLAARDWDDFQAKVGRVLLRSGNRLLDTSAGTGTAVAAATLACASAIERVLVANAGHQPGLQNVATYVVETMACDPETREVLAALSEAPSLWRSLMAVRTAAREDKEMGRVAPFTFSLGDVRWESSEELHFPRFPSLEDDLPLKWMQPTFDRDARVTDLRKSYRVERPRLVVGEPEVRYVPDPASATAVEVTLVVPYRLEGFAPMDFLWPLPVRLSHAISPFGSGRPEELRLENGAYRFERTIRRGRAELAEGRMEWSVEIHAYGLEPVEQTVTLRLPPELAEAEDPEPPPSPSETPGPPPEEESEASDPIPGPDPEPEAEIGPGPPVGPALADLGAARARLAEAAEACRRAQELAAASAAMVEGSETLAGELAEELSALQAALGELPVLAVRARQAAARAWEMAQHLAELRDRSAHLLERSCDPALDGFERQSAARQAQAVAAEAGNLLRYIETAVAEARRALASARALTVRLEAAARGLTALEQSLGTAAQQYERARQAAAEAVARHDEAASALAAVRGALAQAGDAGTAAGVRGALAGLEEELEAVAGCRRRLAEELDRIGNRLGSAGLRRTEIAVLLAGARERHDAGLEPLEEAVAEAEATLATVEMFADSVARRAEEASICARGTQPATPADPVPDEGGGWGPGRFEDPPAPPQPPDDAGWGSGSRVDEHDPCAGPRPAYEAALQAVAAALRSQDLSRLEQAVIALRPECPGDTERLRRIRDHAVAVAQAQAEANEAAMRSAMGRAHERRQRSAAAWAAAAGALQGILTEMQRSQEPAGGASPVPGGPVPGTATGGAAPGAGTPAGDPAAPATRASCLVEEERAYDLNLAHAEVFYVLESSFQCPGRAVPVYGIRGTSREGGGAIPGRKHGPHQTVDQARGAIDRLCPRDRRAVAVGFRC